MPDVPPPDFINACKAVMLNFGNVSSDNQDVMKKIQTIAAEAEIVATRIYGKGMSTQEQQDRAWKEESTSIFDLERMEVKKFDNDVRLQFYTTISNADNTIFHARRFALRSWTPCREESRHLGPKIRPRTKTCSAECSTRTER